jgi:hypothetical protein
MNLLSTKRKSNETNTKQKKLKTNHSVISNGDAKQPIVDCREMPFQGINIKT